MNDDNPYQSPSIDDTAGPDDGVSPDVDAKRQFTPWQVSQAAGCAILMMLMGGLPVVATFFAVLISLLKRLLGD